MDCYCSRCVPTGIVAKGHVSVCSACGEEIRFGTRDGVLAWHHRGAVDHVPRHGHSAPYTTRETTDLPKTEEELAAEALQNAKVEVYAHDVSPEEFSPQSGIRQIANLVSGVTRVMPNGKASKSMKHPPMAPGWELVNLHHARGPYKGSKGEVLSISDTHVLRARAVRVDGTIDIAVASWRDLGFDFAFIGTIKDGRLSPRKVGSDELKDWIKGITVNENDTDG